MPSKALSMVDSIRLLNEKFDQLTAQNAAQQAQIDQLITQLAAQNAAQQAQIDQLTVQNAAQQTQQTPTDRPTTGMQQYLMFYFSHIPIVSPAWGLANAGLDKFVNPALNYLFKITKVRFNK